MKLKLKNPERTIGITICSFSLLKILIFIYVSNSSLRTLQNLEVSFLYLLENFILHTLLLILEFLSGILLIQKKKLGWIGATFFSFKNAFYLIIIYWQFIFLNADAEQPPIYGLIFYLFMIILNLFLGFTLIRKEIRQKYQPSKLNLVILTVILVAYSAYKTLSIYSSYQF